jgi:hypothetical protein
MPKKFLFSRRDFLKTGGLAAAGLALRGWESYRPRFDFPEGEGRLARVAEPQVNLRARPSLDGAELGVLYEDAVVPWLREVVGSNPYRHSQRWVETPEGYVWSPMMQPVYNVPNAPVENLLETSLGMGMWVQVSVPWVDVLLENSNPIAPSVRNRVEEGKLPRLYYSQVLWVDDRRVDEAGQVWYRINDRYG